MQSLIMMGNKFYTEATDEIKENGLPSGCYKLEIGMNAVKLSPFIIESDSLINLPGSKQEHLITEIQTFFNTKTKELFKEHGFLYKKAVLLHGAPGTGKTCVTMQVVNNFLNTYSNGVVIFNPQLDGLLSLYDVIGNTQPIIVIFEEFEILCQSQSKQQTLLSLLDGQIQRSNTLYLFTTNFIDQVPDRMRRPGRVSNVIQLEAPDFKTRFKFLRGKLANHSSIELTTWAEKTVGFSLDELKYSVLACQCLGYTLDKIVTDITNNRPDVKTIQTEIRNQMEEEEDYDDYSGN
jgi:Cdc6-like AAA superfamily ATPase